METQKLNLDNRINFMIRDSIISLCKAMVPYRMQISIKGIIGITIDNTDVLLVDVHDAVANSQNLGRDTQLIKSSSIKTEPVISNGSTADFQLSKCSGAQSETKNSQANSNVKYEISHSGTEGKYNSTPAANAGSSRSVNENDDVDGADDDCNEENGNDADNDDAYGLGYAINSGMWRDGMQEESGSYSYEESDNHHLNSFISPSSSRTESKVPQFTMHNVTFDSQGKVTSSAKKKRLPIPAEEHPFSLSRVRSCLLSTEAGNMYNCSVCGRIIKHLTSFIRHKEKHEGIKYKCENCGKSYSRKDKLSCHKKNCLPGFSYFDAQNNSDVDMFKVVPADMQSREYIGITNEARASMQNVGNFGVVNSGYTVVKDKVQNNVRTVSQNVAQSSDTQNIAYNVIDTQSISNSVS